MSHLYSSDLVTPKFNCLFQICTTLIYLLSFSSNELPVPPSIPITKLDGGDGTGEFFCLSLENIHLWSIKCARLYLTLVFDSCFSDDRFSCEWLWDLVVFAHSLRALHCICLLDCLNLLFLIAPNFWPPRFLFLLGNLSLVGNYCNFRFFLLNRLRKNVLVVLQDL